ncbi:MAG: lamin tail domain-containing protein [Verrucomicrobiales bacterium]
MHPLFLRCVRIVPALAFAGFFSLCYGDVFINEFTADNPGRLLNNGTASASDKRFDIDGNSPDWIELHNSDAAAVSLTGWALSDDAGNPGQWVFPADATLNAGSFMVVYASGKNAARGAGVTLQYHTGFKLAPGGGVLLLSRPDGAGGWTTVSQIGTAETPYPKQEVGISYGAPSPTTPTQVAYFLVDTPGAANNASSAVSEFCKDTTFDIDRGFYDAPFTLQITTETPGATIAYTVNGSEPSATNGTQAPAPDATTPPVATVTISDTTLIRARAIKSGFGPSDVDTQTYIFATSVLQQAGPLTSMNLAPADTLNWGAAGGNLRIPPGPDWEVDPEIVNSTNAANTFSAADLKSIPVVSVVTDWRHMFGPNTPGSNPIDGGLYPALNGVPQESADRPASFELINPTGDSANPNMVKGFQTDGKIHIFGGTSQQRWKSYKLSMNFKPNDEVTYDLYGDDASDEHSTFILDARLNQAWVHPVDTQRSRGDYVRDHVMADFQNAMGGSTFHSKPVHFFLDGLYWGLYILHEKPDHNFQSHYSGGDADEWDVFKHSAINGVDGGTLFHNVMNTGVINPALPASATNSTTLKSYEDLLDLLGVGAQLPNPTVSLVQQAAYEAVWTKLDQDEFIKYMLFNFVAGNQDWAHKNLYASIRRTDPAAKWRFHSWDAEHVFRDQTESFLTRNDRGGPTEIHQRLLVNSEYKLLFADYIHRFMFNEGVLSVNGMKGVFQRRLDEIDSAIRGESARWGDNRREPPYTRGTDWLNEKTRILNTILLQRHANMLTNFRNAGLYSTVAAPEFRNNATNILQHGGNVPDNFELKIHNPNIGGVGTILYTLDGSDPREMWTGVESASAQPYGAPLSLTDSVRVKSRIRNGTAWSALNNAFFVVDAVAASANNVVVSQVHYHPADASQTEIAAGFSNQDDFEFIELMNIGASRVDLTGVTFAAGLDFAFDDSVLLREIGPGQRLLLVKNRAAFQFRYGASLPVAGEFQNLSGLSNGGERLQIIDKSGAPIKDFAYNDRSPWPAAADGLGPALILMRPTTNPDHNNAVNWRSSVAGAATPNAGDALTFSAWRVTRFTPGQAVDEAVSGPAADPDRDGFKNFLEYVFGTDPTVADAGSVRIFAVVESVDTPAGPQDFAALSLTLWRGADDAVLEVVSSTDLASWDTANVVFSSRTENADGTETRVYRSTEPFITGFRLYFKGLLSLP